MISPVQRMQVCCTQHRHFGDTKTVHFDHCCDLSLACRSLVPCPVMQHCRCDSQPLATQHGKTMPGIQEVKECFPMRIQTFLHVHWGCY